jgi:ABC-type uncharacterized transport system ATPase subunit
LREFDTRVDPSTPVRALTQIQRMMVEVVKAYAHGARVLLLCDLSRTLSPLEIVELMGCVDRL